MNIKNKINIGLKKAFTIKNSLTNASSQVLSDYTPSYSSYIYKRLSILQDQYKKLSKGVEIIREDHDEFCRGSTGAFSSSMRTNPLIGKKNRIIGGSSNEGAYNLLAGLTDISISSDTGGSARFPALCSGLVGFYPGKNDKTRYGLIEYCPFLDSASYMTKKENLSLLSEIYSFISQKEITKNKKTLTEKNIHNFFSPSEIISLNLYYSLSTELYLWSSLQRYDGIKFSNKRITYVKGGIPSITRLNLKRECKRIVKFTFQELTEKKEKWVLLEKEVESMIYKKKEEIGDNLYFYEQSYQPPLKKDSHEMREDESLNLIINNILSLPSLIVPKGNNKYNIYYCFDEISLLSIHGI